MQTLRDDVERKWMRTSKDILGEPVSDVKWRDEVVQRVDALVDKHGDPVRAATTIAKELRMRGEQGRFFDEFAVETLKQEWLRTVGRERGRLRLNPPGDPKVDVTKIRKDRSVFDMPWRAGRKLWKRLGDMTRDDLSVIVSDNSRLRDAYAERVIINSRILEGIKDGQRVRDCFTEAQLRAILGMR